MEFSHKTSIQTQNIDQHAAAANEYCIRQRHIPHTVPRLSKVAERLAVQWSQVGCRLVKGRSQPTSNIEVVKVQTTAIADSRDWSHTTGLSCQQVV